MKVILTENISTLGNVGEMVNVSKGHARNYLIPNNFAVLADETNKKQFEDNKRRLALKIAEEKNKALEIKKKIDGQTLELTKKVGGNGRLFGTVTNTELAKEFSEKGVEIDRRQISIEKPIKTLGSFEVKAKVFTDVEAVFNVKVAMDPKQAQEEKAKQAAAAKRASEKKKKTKAEATDPEEAIAEDTNAEKPKAKVEKTKTEAKK
ncbi:MAG: 50S ribosomal protein L9 [Bacteriovoracaceae bacterium]|nr:50S ribosomal protein L9 [Bacteriovoracaceae bacterium]